jgi:hypothetical protein
MGTKTPSAGTTPTVGTTGTHHRRVTNCRHLLSTICAALSARIHCVHVRPSTSQELNAVHIRRWKIRAHRPRGSSSTSTCMPSSTMRAALRENARRRSPTSCTSIDVAANMAAQQQCDIAHYRLKNPGVRHGWRVTLTAAVESRRARPGIRSGSDGARMPCSRVRVLRGRSVHVDGARALARRCRGSSCTPALSATAHTESHRHEDTSRLYSNTAGGHEDDASTDTLSKDELARRLVRRGPSCASGKQVWQ